MDAEPQGWNGELDLAVLRAFAGPERFDAACAWAWRTAADDSRRSSAEWPDDLSMVPHELDDFWYSQDVPIEVRFRVGLELYRAMPCYWNAVGPYTHFRDLPETHRPALWTAFRALLDDPDDRLADPLWYAVAVEWFEDRSIVAEAWAQLVLAFPTDRRTAGAVARSGPVPWEVKHLTLRDLLARPSWHAAVAGALVSADREYFGHLDREGARALAAVIRPTVEVDGFTALVARLGADGGRSRRRGRR